MKFREDTRGRRDWMVVSREGTEMDEVDGRTRLIGS